MNESIELLRKKILDYSGINLASTQHQNLVSYIEKKAVAKEMLPIDYCRSLTPNTPDFDELINLITIKETYFFREELQFDFLKKEIFPKFMGRNLTIWICCCATGEEAISLLALALSMNVNLTLYASDIDEGALKILKNGHYSTLSLRTDGLKYHKLLEPHSTRNEKEIIFHHGFLSHIHSFKFNLVNDSLEKLPFSENVDILFIRNLFIYFDSETRALVTKKIGGKLKENGLLFFSMSEIGSLNEKLVPENFYKTNRMSVYYFVKKNSAGNGMQFSDGTTRLMNEREKNRKNEKLKEEVKKMKLQRLEEQNEKIRNAKISLYATTAKKDFDAKQVYEDICMEINHRNFEKARAMAKSITGKDAKKYSYFMQGYVEYLADNRTEADVLFSNAEKLSDDFWPAFFYHGMLFRDLGKTGPAQNCFSKCRKIISDFGNKNPYDFTLDSFSPAYISSLCETFSMGAVNES